MSAISSLVSAQFDLLAAKDDEINRLREVCEELVAFAEAYRLDLQERGVQECDMDEAAMELLSMADAALAKAGAVP